MRMLVLGAGASHGSSEIGDVRPPLVEGFFPAADEVGLFGEQRYNAWRNEIEEEHDIDMNRLAQHLGLAGLEGHTHLLKRFVAEQLDVAPNEYGDAEINIERLMGLVEGELLGRHGLVRMRQGRPPAIGAGEALEAQLHLVICGTLIAATRGCRCAYHDTVLGTLDPGDAVVSFNYDLLADRALSERGDWARNDGYDLDFFRVGDHAGIEGEWREPLDTESAVTLLKLHGSLNWLYPRSPAEAHGHPNMHGQAVQQPSSVLYCLDDMNPHFEEDMPLYEWWGRYDHWEEGSAYDLYSVIVPPSITKHYRDWEGFLGPLWTKALVAGIRDVQEITFIGYSLRREDLRSWWLFRKIASQANRLETVRVVDPSDVVLERYREVFGTDRVEHSADTLEDFANLVA